MVLATSGVLYLGTTGTDATRQVRTEFSLAANTCLTDARDAAGLSGAVCLSDFYGLSAGGMISTDFVLTEGSGFATIQNSTFPDSTNGFDDFVGSFVPHNGPNETDTLNSAWTRQESNGDAVFFDADWPDDGSVYANWQIGVIIDAPGAHSTTIVPFDRLQLRIIDFPTYNSGAPVTNPVAGTALFTTPPSVTTDPGLWTSFTLTVRGQDSGATTEITLQRADAAAYQVNNGTVAADIGTLRQPPNNSWLFDFTPTSGVYLDTALFNAFTPTWAASSLTPGERLEFAVEIN